MMAAADAIASDNTNALGYALRGLFVLNEPRSVDIQRRLPMLVVRMR